MVRINEINIISFGKIENLTLKFNNCLNVIYGLNETGKSTVQAFIKAMLYGIGKKRKTDAMSDRARFMPWDKNVMMGNMLVDLDGRKIEIARRFGKTAAGDRVSVTDKISGMAIEELNISAPGEILFGMSAQMFEKTLWINQNGMYMGGVDEEITTKLTNLAQTHNEDISHIKALEILKDKKSALKAESRRNKNGIIDDIDARTEELLKLKSRAIVKLDEKNRLQSERQMLIEKREISEKNLVIAEQALTAQKNAELVERADKLRKYVSDAENIKQMPDYLRFKDFENNEPSDVEKLYSESAALKIEISKYEALRDSVDALEFENDKRKINIYKALSLCLFAAAIITFFVYIPVSIALIILSAIGLAAVVLNSKSYAEKSEKIQKKVDDYEEKLNELNSCLNAVDEKLGYIFKVRGLDNISEYRTYYNKYNTLNAKLDAVRFAFKNLLNNDNYEDLIQKADELRETSISNEILKYSGPKPSEIRQQLPIIERRLSDIENKLAYEYSERFNIADIENEITALEEKRKSSVFELKATEAAVCGIEEAYLSIRTEFGPALNDSVNEMLSFLTEGKYSEFRVSDMYKIKVACMGEAREAEYLSTGTYEQIYLALRLGIAKLVLNENTIMFLDDAFSSFDDIRSKKAMELLKNYSENSQVIMLSCHLRDAEFAKEFAEVAIMDLNMERGN